MTVQASPWFSTKRCATASALRAIAFDEFDRAQQVGNVPVVGLLDQESPDFDLRMTCLR